MKILIGTSGWMYKDWNGRFYPEKMKDKDKLPYLASKFHTVEINSSFYRMPGEATFSLWQERVHAGFVFSVKMPRYFTQMKKLRLDEDSKPFLGEFINRIKLLKENLGSVLIQLPPNFGCNKERLEEFICYVKSYSLQMKINPDYCIEFRHGSWFNDEIFEMLSKYNIGFVISDSSKWPQLRIFTADFSYVRFHGPKELFASAYSDKELDDWANFIAKQKNIKKIYIYFNNDLSAKAIDNAIYLQGAINRLMPEENPN